MILADAATIKRYKDEGVWGEATLDAVFRKVALSRPDEPALMDPPNRADFTANPPRRLTYGALLDAVERLAVTFIGLGLKKDDVIAVQLPNIAEQAVVFLAAWRAGLIVSPLPLMWRTHELKSALPLIAPSAIITIKMHDFDAVDTMRHIAFEQLTLRFVMAFGPGLPDGVMPLDGIFEDRTADIPAVDDILAEEMTADDIAIVTWAGGDCPTACPVPRSHNQWIAAGLMPLLEARIGDKSAILNPYPLTGLVPIGCFFMPWILTGGKMVLHHPFDLAVFTRQVLDEDIVFTGLPPSVIEVVKSEGIFQHGDDDGGLRKIACIWPSPVLPAGAADNTADFGVDVIDVRNLWEMAMVIRPRENDAKPALIPHGEWHAPFGGGQGPVLMEARVKGSSSLNSTGISLLGGELLIRSPMMFDKYFPPPDENLPVPSLFKDHSGFVGTGHRCTLEGGSDAMIDLQSGDSNTIVHGGLWISAPELDQLYANHDQLADAAVFTYADAVMGERIMAAVVPNPGADVSLADFQDYLKQCDVAAYKMPDRLITVKTIPRGDNGEVLRSQVLEEI